MENCQQWFHLCVGFLIVIMIMLAMFFNYNLKLDQRTLKLEKKNGYEQHQIDDLKEKILSLEGLLTRKISSKLKSHG